MQCYAKCGGVEDVENLFSRMSARDGFTWNEMVNAYMGFGLVSSVLDHFRRMPGKNSIAYKSLLAGFCENGDGSKALRLYCRMVEEGVELTDSIMLTTMICGYSRQSELVKAISLFSYCHSEERIAIDEVALASILLWRFGVSNSWRTVSMYSMCGDMDRAIKVFDSMSKHDIVSWNCLLAGYALNRKGEKALNSRRKMMKARVKPNTVTCVLIISAYRHTKSNLVDQCLDFFLSMKHIHNTQPNSVMVSGVF